MTVDAKPIRAQDRRGPARTSAPWRLGAQYRRDGGVQLPDLVAWDKLPPGILVSNNVVVNGRRTSLRLEPAVWRALDVIAESVGGAVDDVVSWIDGQRTQTWSQSLTHSVQEYVTAWLLANRGRP